MGNNRVVYADGNNNGVIEPTEILEENNYYPFGLKHQGYNDMTGSTASNYKYQYNGKELQEEMGLNLYDFGARNYDPALGRWMNIDPLAENSRRWTPYNYAYNNPILFVDPDGMQSYVFNGKAAQDFAKDLQSQLALNDGVENDCKSCKTKADWDAYYQQAENTAAMMGEDAWGYTNKRLTREMDEQGHSIFYLDGERMDLRQYRNKADAAGNLISDAALIEASVGFLKYISSFFKSSNATAKTGKSFFEGTKYTNKVLGQMKKGDFHGFPEAVKAFESSGVITTIKGGDGVTRQILKIPGEYGSKKGFFEFIKEADGTINHRLFRPNP